MQRKCQSSSSHRHLKFLHFCGETLRVADWLIPIRQGAVWECDPHHAASTPKVRSVGRVIVASLLRLSQPSRARRAMATFGSAAQQYIRQASRLARSWTTVSPSYGEHARYRSALEVGVSPHLCRSFDLSGPFAVVYCSKDVGRRGRREAVQGRCSLCDLQPNHGASM